MHDMLVKLYDLPSLEEALAAVARQGVTVRRALAPEKHAVLDWVRAHFAGSAAEVETAFEQVPTTCFIAVRDDAMLGFACYDVTCRNFFGPEGVAAIERGRGIGRALLLAALHAQRAQGYAYAIIGGVGPAEFYAKTVGAVPIADSTPGIYAGLLPYAAKTD
jgi:GNAT superfamily N-acetyltransferase